MAHFEKLNTRLRSVQRYPTTDAQNRRFQQLGWTSVSIRNLWELWASSDFLSPSERQALDHVEPFDEWEEFALFGCHYFILVADNSELRPENQTLSFRSSFTDHTLPIHGPLASTQEMQIGFSKNPTGQGCTRFGAVLPLRSSTRNKTRFGNHAGMGLKTRMNSYDVFALSEINNNISIESELAVPLVQPSSRMCHTITDMEDGTSLLVGGRTSPDKGLMDCWVYHKWVGVWEPVGSLPYPLYRHQAVFLGNGCVLVSTGRINSRDLSKQYLIWSRALGWVQCHQAGEKIPPSTHGSIFLVKPSDSRVKKCGLIVGGLSEDAVIQSDLWLWEIEKPFSEVINAYHLWQKPPKLG
jgi:tRNA wybutosine-synthesizing protein 4